MNRTILPVVVFLVTLFFSFAEKSIPSERRKKPECDSLVYLTGWNAEDIAGRQAAAVFKDEAYWIGGTAKKKVSMPDTTTFAWNCERPDFLSVSGKLNCRLRKDQVYRLCVDIKADRIDSGLKCIGFSIIPGMEFEPLTIPRFRISRYDMDSMEANVWKRVVFLLVATGEETGITITKLAPGKKRLSKTVVLVRNLHLELAGSPASLDPENLIINGDMELYRACPSYLQAGGRYFYYWQKETEIENACISSRDEENASRPYVDLGTPDLYTMCGGYDAVMTRPFSGRNYALLSLCPLGAKGPTNKWNYGGEFLQGELKSSLEKDANYRMTFAYMKSPGSDAASNSLGVKFTDCPFSSDSYNNKSIMPNGNYFVSDSVNTSTQWIVCNIEFTANGTEKYVTIGPFRKDSVEETIVKTKPAGYGAGTGYYYVDDFRLEKR